MKKYKFQNKYRIHSARLQNWDYGWSASYFITICTANRDYYFGDVCDGKMNYSEIGEKAYQCWLEIPEHFSFVKLDVHVVMPNHVHGIIVIDKPDDYTRERNAGCNVETQYFASSPETQNIAFLQPPPPPSPHEQTQKPKNQFGPQSQNMASIVRGYKTGVTIYARNNNINFTWQPRFYDHIIRNDSEYQRIKDYIINNPKNWNDDKFHNK